MENFKYCLIINNFKKAISISLALIILFLPGCAKKESGRGAEQSADYYFKATLGGRKIVYRAANFQGGGNDDRWEHIVVGGFEGPLIPGDRIGPDGLSFEIWRLGGNIGPGQYSTPAEKNMTAKTLFKPRAEQSSTTHTGLMTYLTLQSMLSANRGSGVHF